MILGTAAYMSPGAGARQGRSTSARTSGPSASCCTRCSPAGGCSRARRSATRWRPCSPRDPDWTALPPAAPAPLCAGCCAAASSATRSSRCTTSPTRASSSTKARSRRRRRPAAAPASAKRQPPADRRPAPGDGRAFAAGPWMGARAPPARPRRPRLCDSPERRRARHHRPDGLVSRRPEARFPLERQSEPLCCARRAGPEAPSPGNRGSRASLHLAGRPVAGVLRRRQAQEGRLRGRGPGPHLRRPGEGPGVSWGLDGSIYLTPTFTSGLFRVDAGGGAPVQLTTPDRTRGEAGHIWADPLPGEKALVFTLFGGSGMNESKIALLDLPSRRYEVLLEGAGARYVASGHLVFYSGAPTTPSRSIPPRGVTGPPRPCCGRETARPHGSKAAPRVLRRRPARLRSGRGAFLRKGIPPRVDFPGCAGTLALRGGPPFGARSLSRNGQRVAVTRYASGETQIWTYDLARGTQEQVTREGVQENPVWHPDGRHLGYTSMVDGTYDLWWAAIDGSRPAGPSSRRPGTKARCTGRAMGGRWSSRSTPRRRDRTSPWWSRRSGAAWSPLPWTTATPVSLGTEVARLPLGRCPLRFALPRNGNAHPGGPRRRGSPLVGRDARAVLHQGRRPDGGPLLVRGASSKWSHRGASSRRLAPGFARPSMWPPTASASSSSFLFEAR